MSEKKKTKKPGPGLPVISIQGFKANEDAVNQALWGRQRPPQIVPPPGK